MFNSFIAYFIQKNKYESESNHDHKNNLKLIPENKSKSKSKEIILSPRGFMKFHWGWTI
tara:strand:- start:663 stop:839 length:177 start_codon:yes stop_codon:yes gene_type:complete